MRWIATLIFFLAVILSALTTFPVIVSMILCFTVVSKSPKIFILAILGGLLIDVFFLRIPGSTSLFLVIFAFMIFLYQKRFEIQTYVFVFIGTFLGSVIYLKIFGYDEIFLQSLVSSLLALFLFRVFNRFNVRKNEP